MNNIADIDAKESGCDGETVRASRHTLVARVAPDYSDG